MRHTVNRGDSLWSLAVKYQGSGTQWPKLVEHHNNEVARHGPNSGLLAIEDENLIYIGQTLFLPPRPKSIERGTGDKSAAKNLAKSFDLKVNYGIGRDTPPCVWTSHSVEFDINAELKGDITIEMLSESRHRHNLELALSRDGVEIKQKLKELYDPAISKLLAEPSVKFEKGKLRLNSPIKALAKGSIGDYEIEVTSSGLNHLSGTLTPPTIKSTMEAKGYKYEYSADIAFKIDVYLHPKAQPVREQVKVTGEEKVPAPQPNQDVGIEPIVHTSRWQQTVNEKGVVMAVVLVACSVAASILYRLATRGGVILQPAPNGSIMSPFIYTIDGNSPVT